MENVIHRITINPEICNGTSIIRNMRITVQTVLEYLGAGETIDNILEAYPILEKEDIYACLQYAALTIEREITNYKLANVA